MLLSGRRRAGAHDVHHGVIGQHVIMFDGLIGQNNWSDEDLVRDKRSLISGKTPIMLRQIELYGYSDQRLTAVRAMT